MSEETKESTEYTVESMKESVKLQQQFTQVCTAIGDLTFKLEDLKTVQMQLAQQYKKALETEAPAETK